MNICVHSCTGPRERVLAEHLLLVRYKAPAVSLIYYSIPGGPMCGRPTITYSIDYRIAAPSVATLDCWNPLFILDILRTLHLVWIVFFSQMSRINYESG